MILVRIYLTRHGQTEWNVEKRMQGQQNSDLTELGKRQATGLGDCLKEIDLDIIYSSSSPRALQTAELIRAERQMEIIPEDDLREIYLGCWETLLFSEVENRYPDQFDNFWNHPEKYVPLNGESFETLRVRIGNKLEEIAKKHQGETILIVTHGIVLKTLYTYFRNQPIKEILYSPHPKSTCLCMVEKKDGIWNILNWNDVGHYRFL